MFIEPDSLSCSEIKSCKRSNTSTDSISDASNKEELNFESYTEFWNRFIKKSGIDSYLGFYEKGSE